MHQLSGRLINGHDPLILKEDGQRTGKHWGAAVVNPMRSRRASPSTLSPSQVQQMSASAVFRAADDVASSSAIPTLPLQTGPFATTVVFCYSPHHSKQTRMTSSSSNAPIPSTRPPSGHHSRTPQRSMNGVPSSRFESGMITRMKSPPTPSAGFSEWKCSTSRMTS